MDGFNPANPSILKILIQTVSPQPVFSHTLGLLSA